MSHLRKIIIIFFLLSQTYANDISKLYQKVPPYEYLYNVYDDYIDFIPRAFNKDELDVWLGVLGSTLVTYYYDQEIYEATRDFGNSIGLDEFSVMKKAFCIHPKACLQVPSDLATTFYYLGDGITYAIMAGSFLTYGAINSDNRAISTGYQIIEGIIDIGIVTQLLKRITGRETPLDGTKARGQWDLFVDWETYQKDVPKYDAYPSGHVAAMSVAFTILNENYPEYSMLIKSTYGVALTIVSFEMMHQGVHWASDYPLGIAIGYYFGKIVSSRYKPYNHLDTLKTKDNNTIILPLIGENKYGLQFKIHY